MPPAVLTAIDLCCGGGGWEIAARGLPIRFLAAYDWAEDCCLTTKLNDPGVPVVRADVTRIDFARLRGVDLVLGAIPCEEISVARHGYGREASPEQMAAWHALLDGILEGVEAIAPRWWAIENVTPMRRHLPPLVPQVILDARDWSGQSRKRIFLGNFPVPAKATSRLRTIGEYLQPGPYITTPAILRATQRSRRQWYGKGCKRVIEADRPSPTITDFGGRHSRGFLVEMEDGRERILQFTEAAALQGFPRDYLFVGSLTRAWKMVAQAIQIDLGRAILRAICEEAAKKPAAPVKAAERKWA